ncbi:transcription factor IIIA-like [Tubulanus polymorphus]|uniref:transcription factor IIIA-like n=1 Tax=Tubulanus polymorphus TaxID=672921 RepID=UPI003DA346BD
MADGDVVSGKTNREIKSTRPSVYLCSFENCGKTFSRPDRLEHHTRTHTGERPYACNHCDRTYTRSAHLQRHIDKSHIPDDKQNKIIIQCPHDDCSQSFVSQDNLNKHIQRRHETHVYKCKDCDKVFKKHHHLRGHEFTHTGVKPYKCTHEGCEKSFVMPSKLKLHMRIHEGYKCTHHHCSEVFEKWSVLRKHLATKHKQGLTCDTCSQVFPNKQKLRRHLQCHSDARQVFICPRDGCPRVYLDKRNLVAHIKSYHDGQRFPCLHKGCGHTFVTKQKLELHMKLHDPDRPKPKKKKRKSSRKIAFATKLSGHRPATTTTDDNEHFSETSDEEQGHQINIMDGLDKSYVSLCRNNNVVDSSSVNERISNDHDYSMKSSVSVANTDHNYTMSVSLEPCAEKNMNFSLSSRVNDKTQTGANMNTYNDGVVVKET